MENWKVENVPVTVHLTPEAVGILRQYASERTKGRFLSELLIAQRRRDEREAERIRAKAVADEQNQAVSKKKRRR